MIRLIFVCLTISLLSVSYPSYAEESELAPIPEPPELTPQTRKNTPLRSEAKSSSEAEQSSSVPPVASPEAPDLPMPIKSGETLEPDITIIKRGDKTFQEFRRNGELYMVKVIPDKGPAYYLIDINGDGKLDIRGSDLNKGLNINQWKLLEWN
jgi:hypothetical protein